MFRTTRRLVLRAGLFAGLAPVLAACAASPTNTPAPNAPPSGSSSTGSSTSGPTPKPSSTEATAKPTAVSATPAPTAAGEKVQVTFMGNHALAPAKAVEAAIDAFRQKNSTIEVQWVNVPEGYEQKLQTMVAGGQPPDLYRLGGDQFASYAYRGFMLPLDEYMSRDSFDRDEFYPGALDQYVWNGKQLGLISGYGNRVLYYNVDLWKAAQLPDPLPDTRAEGWTFDDFREAAREMTKREGDRIVEFGFVNTLDWMTWPLANGGSLWNAESTESTIHEPEAIEALQFLQDLMFKDGVAQTKEMAAELAPAQAFLTGKSGMTIGSIATGVTTYRQINAFDWNVIMLPRGPSLQGERRVFGGGSSWHIYEKTTHPEEAWQVLRHMTSKEADEILAKAGFMPGRPAIVNSPAFLDPSLPPASKQVMVDSPRHIVPFPKSTTWREWVTAINQELDALWNNRTTAAELAPRLKEVSDPLVRKHLENLKGASSS